jgi:hypothetical protein
MEGEVFSLNGSFSLAVPIGVRPARMEGEVFSLNGSFSLVALYQIQLNVYN